MKATTFLGVMLAANLAWAGVQTVTYTLPVDYSTARIVQSGYDGYKDIECEGLDVILEPAGAPRLLTSVIRIDVPKKAKLIKATYEADWVTLGENIRLVPVQPLIIGEEPPKEIPFVEPDPALYASYPQSPIATFGAQRMAGKAFVPVRVIPFRYTNGKLEADRSPLLRFSRAVELAVELAGRGEDHHGLAARADIGHPAGAEFLDELHGAVLGEGERGAGEGLGDGLRDQLLAPAFAALCAAFGEVSGDRRENRRG